MLRTQRNVCSCAVLSVYPTQVNTAIGRLAVDKGVANRFIKHAIAQVKFGRPPGQDEGAQAEGSNVRVPVKVTSKMIERAQYEKELKELGSEEEDDLVMIDDASESDATTGSEASVKGKGKERAGDMPVQDETAVGQKRRRPQVDPFAGKHCSRGSIC